MGTGSGSIKKMVDIFLPKMKELEDARYKIAAQQKQLEDVKKELQSIEDSKKEIDKSKAKISSMLSKIEIKYNGF